MAKKYHPDTNQEMHQRRQSASGSNRSLQYVKSDPERKKCMTSLVIFASKMEADRGGAYGGAYSRNGGSTYQYAGTGQVHSMNIILKEMAIWGRFSNEEHFWEEAWWLWRH